MRRQTPDNASYASQRGILNLVVFAALLGSVRPADAQLQDLPRIDIGTGDVIIGTLELTGTLEVRPGEPPEPDMTVVAAKLEPAIYQFQLASRKFADRIRVVSPDGEPFPTELDVSAAVVEIISIGGLFCSDIVQVIQADRMVGKPTFIFPDGVTFDTSNFPSSGELQLVGCHSMGPWPPNFDSDHDKDVDSIDLGAFIASWTGSLDAGPAERLATVPEPSSIVLAVLAVLLSIGGRRRRELRS